MRPGGALRRGLSRAAVGLAVLVSTGAQARRDTCESRCEDDQKACQAQCAKKAGKHAAQCKSACAQLTDPCRAECQRGEPRRK